MNDKFKKFGNSITALISGIDLSRKQTKKLVSEILNSEQTDIHQGAFLAAITAKGPCPDEIAGAWDAIYDIDTVKIRPDIKQPMVDNCGTGMDSFKTFNISTASAIVAAAGGVCLARHGARAVTSRCGTVDLCETLGVDVECPVETVKTSIEKTGIGLFNAMSPFVHPQALFRILSQMSFGSILNIAASLANPVMPEYGVRGVYAKEMISPVIETMKEIGFKKAMVFYGSSGNGRGGMDELSPISESWIAELSEDGNIEHYALSPETLGIRYPVTPDEIAGGNDPETEALRLLKVFTSKDKKALYETICLNAAPIFYVAGKTTGITSGIEKSRHMIDSGKAMDKLKEWVVTQHREPDTGKKQLEHLMQQLN
ncbi:MAG: anthranilate phosphoribosyltransferase [Desulfobacteraceae bacterium Eth-SRB2]|nr:MAG: anthranilate phosphoribosyltransferase [Desulfobacteraceae bacterium Eth-SRB2]